MPWAERSYYGHFLNPVSSSNLAGRILVRVSTPERSSPAFPVRFQETHLFETGEPMVRSNRIVEKHEQAIWNVSYM